MIRVVSLVGIMVLMFIRGASAESSSEALKVFGLVGTWSDNCADASAHRITYAAPMIGAPSASMVGGQSWFDAGKTWNIEAVRVTEDKIKLTLSWSDSRLSVDEEAVIQKKDGKIITVQYRDRENGGKWFERSGPFPIFEKCLN